MRYDTLKNLLVRRYSQVTNNETTFYKNRDGKVVATENQKQNLIVMYVCSDRNTVWNHNDVVAVAIAKEFKLICNGEVNIADVVVINGLCGTYNTIERVLNMCLEVTSSRNVSFDKTESCNFSEPIKIINRGVLDSPQFKDSNLEGALIDVVVEDASGKRFKAPYIVGKGLALATHEIGTMGCMLSPTVISLDVGVEIDMSSLAGSRNNWNRNTKVCYNDPDEMHYGVLRYKKKSRKAKKKNSIKRIQPKDYQLYEYLRKKHSWYWENGYNTCNSNVTRSRIIATKTKNYHNIAMVTVTVK